MGARNDNTIVIIPSYNEAKTIGGIVQDIVKMGLGVLVIDDGSIDNTDRIALDNGAMVISHKQNFGKGYSIRQGLSYVLEKTKYKWMIIMDGDGQHHTEDVPSLIEATQEKGTDMVIGNRMANAGEMPHVRYWTNKFMSWLISGICGQHIPDTQCGYRLIKVDALKKLELLSDKYDMESEMLIEAAEEGTKIKSVPIQTIYGEEVSAIHPVKDTIRFILLILRYHFGSKKKKRKGKKNG